MKKLFGLLVVGLVVIGLAGPAAASYTFDMGDGSYFTGSALSDPGLVMYANVNSNLDSINFTLDSGGSYSFYFATLGTLESDVEWGEDDVAQEIFAYIEFDAPDLVAAIGGTSIGFAGLFHFNQGWTVTWNDPVEVYLGNGNYMTLDLSNASFGNDWWQGPDGEDCINLTVTYTHVPVPAAVWLLGSGLVGLVGLRRKFSA